MRAVPILAILLIACEGSSVQAPSPKHTPPARALAAEPQVAEFAPPSEAERRRAIGSTSDPAFAPGDFTPIRAPEPSDWLAEHREPGQTFAQFVSSKPNVPSKGRRTIYLVPLGALDVDTEVLQRYARAYYSLPVELMDTIDLEHVGATSRRNSYTGDTQLLTRDILRYLKTIVPKDAYALIALTDVDLYPDPSWNFVFGQASLRDRVGVYSFARYDDPDAKLVLRRQLKLMVHELGHIFGVQHCVFFECVLNGSNHMEETDARPLHACPVCLRKLQRSIGLDPAERYRGLLEFYRDTGLDAEARWVEGRLETINAAVN